MSPKYKLTYFKVKGKAEAIRMLLAYGKQDFEDIFIENEKWPEIKPTMPLGKVPVLEVDGKVYHQADAICRYLAKKFGLAGSNDEESLRMDIVVATLHDLMAELRKARSIQDEKEIAAKENKSCAEIFSYYTSKLEAIVKANGGYFVNGKLSWADIQFASGSENATRMLGADVLEQYPLLKSLKKTVLEEPNIKAWLCRREPVG